MYCDKKRIKKLRFDRTTSVAGITNVAVFGLNFSTVIAFPASSSVLNAYRQTYVRGARECIFIIDIVGKITFQLEECCLYHRSIYITIIIIKRGKFNVVQRRTGSFAGHAVHKRNTINYYSSLPLAHHSTDKFIGKNCDRWCVRVQGRLRRKSVRRRRSDRRVVGGAGNRVEGRRWCTRKAAR
jgi:hypothetical protein